MYASISKWGNSLGIRIPVSIAEALGLQAGDPIDFEMKDGGLFVKKRHSTAQIFEQFYGKPFDELTLADLGPAEKMDWGIETGGENF